MGFEKFFDYIFNFIKLFQIWTVIYEYEEGVLYFLGKTSRRLGPGAHWILPLTIHTVAKENVVYDDMEFTEQNILSKDGKVLSCRGVCFWSICDIVKFENRAEKAESVLGSICKVSIRKVIRSLSMADIISLEPEAMDRLLTASACSRQPGEFGLRIHDLRLSDDPVPTRVLRILQD